MRTRSKHLLHASTVEAVRDAKNGTWAETATGLGFAANMGATLSDVARGKPSAVTTDGEAMIRAALHLPPLPAPIVLALCPSCGGDHGLQGIPDCHGVPVAAVVCLAPGATIRKPAPLPTRWRDYSTATLARIFAARQDYHGTALA